MDRMVITRTLLLDRDDASFSGLNIPLIAEKSNKGDKDK